MLGRLPQLKATTPVLPETAEQLFCSFARSLASLSHAGAKAGSPQPPSAALAEDQLGWPRLAFPFLPPPKLSGKAVKQDPVSLQEAVQQLQSRKRRFDETIEARFALGTDPKRGDQNVRGAAALPHSTGRQARICVFASGQDAEDARRAGAHVVGDEDLIASIQARGSAAVNFDTCAATRDLMPRLARLGRILGPRGLMPNPKLGTVLEPGTVGAAVQRMQGGRVQYKADRSAMVLAGIAKLSHPQENIEGNICALAQALLQIRPSGVKGSGVNGYFLRLHLSSTQGPGVPVSLPSLVQAMQTART